MYLQQQESSVIVVRHMRGARSHWDARCDRRGSIARKQASGRRMRPGLRGLRPREARYMVEIGQ
jgi:hypothetical protein